MADALAATAAFNELIDTLSAIRDDYVLSDKRFRDDLERVEGYRYVTHLLSEAAELLVEADADRPRFSSIVSPARKFLGDNPDALYQQAVIRGDRSYRVTGRRDGQVYISFTVHGADSSGGINGAVLADINHHDIDIDDDGRFELILSPKKHPGNWLEIDSRARFVFVRNYYLTETSAQNDPNVHVQLHIEPLDDPGPPPPLSDATFASRLRDATAFLHAGTMGLRMFDADSTAPFSSNELNTVGTPWSFRNANIDAAGAVDIFYSSGRFDLAPGKALVMEGTLPEGEFVNVMLWNVHMQTLEYRFRRCSLNETQMQLDSERGYRIVISAEDPGVANWLDTGGHRRGTIFWRFLLPKSQPATPRCRVVDVSTLASS
jgi:hypothetical protein